MPQPPLAAKPCPCVASMKASHSIFPGTSQECGAALQHGEYWRVLEIFSLPKVCVWTLQPGVLRHSQVTTVIGAPYLHHGHKGPQHSSLLLAAQGATVKGSSARILLHLAQSCIAGDAGLDLLPPAHRLPLKVCWQMEAWAIVLAVRM